MVIEKVDILNFKNISEAALEFSPGVNCLLGRNGMGKSNLLEALHFVCMARPMSSMPESGLIRHGEDLMSVRASFVMDSALPHADAPEETHGDAPRELVNIGIVRGRGKSLKRNGKDYDRLSQHIGVFPVVSVTPADSALVTGAAQERRRMIDMAVSQADAGYLAWLIRYNRSLEQRNGMLRAGMRDALLFESVEAAMAEAAAEVFRRRRAWVEAISPTVAANYEEIAGSGEPLDMAFSSALSEASMAEVLDRNRQRDAALGYTSAGPHRDDLSVSLSGFPLRSFGSQGQVKSFTVALRLAVFDHLRRSGSETPLLLLDDIFDKLDSVRVGRIMQLVSRSDAFGQIFITDTNREHLDETLAGLSGPRQLLSVESGTFKEISKS